METNSQHFREIFWFCAITEFLGLVFLSALIWIPVPKENQSMANIAIGFVTATVISVPLTYLLGGNIIPAKKTDSPGTIDGKITGTIKTDGEQ